MQDTRATAGFFLSLAMHALLIAAGVFGIGNSMKVDMDKPMYTVDLVSLNPSEDPAAGEMGDPAAAPPPEDGGEQQAVQPAAAIPPPPKAEKLQPAPLVRDDAKAISEKKVDEKKKPEKKEDKTPPKPEEKKPTREELLKEALKDVKKDVTDKAADRAKDAKAALDKARDAKKDQVAGELAALRKSTGGNIFTADGAGPGGAGGGKGSGAGGTGSGLMSVYGDIIKQIIKKNWRYPAFGVETNVAVVLEINIDQKGAITGVRVAQPSGKPDFDDSALRAVHETQTLPPPRTKSLDTLRITFNLQELRK